MAEGDKYSPTSGGDKAVPTQHVEYVGSEKSDVNIVERAAPDSSLSQDEKTNVKPPSTAREFATEILAVEDDPSQNPFTFRMWFLGIGISVFAGTITTINTFKPQSVHIHLVFIAAISYIFGTAMAKTLPSQGRIGRILNPGPFNKKEHAAICIMCAASANTPEAMAVLAVQKLYYNITPSPAVGIFLILSTQMLGYGIAGLLRKTLVYPSNMLYPSNLATASLLESLHADRKSTKKKMRVFYIGFLILFVWQAFPQYIMPLLAGVSVFCLTNRKSLLITNVFGGSMANEGLGLFSLSFDWTMVSGGGNPLWMPFQTMMNTMAGYILSIAIYLGLYYGNVWNARNFPFLSPQLFSHKSKPTKYHVYNQTAILNKRYQVDEVLLKKHGLPWLPSSEALAMTVTNVAITAAMSHMVLWHWKDIKSAFEIITFKQLFTPSQWNLKFWKHRRERISREEADAIDPHYGLMQEYDDVPSWWFGLLWTVSAVVGLITSNIASSTLPWWAFFVSIGVSTLTLTFFAAMTAMFGYGLKVEPLIQMIGAYLLPGLPMANLYFATFGNNSMVQAKHMLKDLKLGQYVHLEPKCTFAMQIIGASIGCIMSYLMMEQITTEKRDILLAIQGTNVWSGQMLQKHNSAAITWGGLASKLYSAGARYQWVSLGFLLGTIIPLPFWLIHKYFPKLKLDYWNTPIILFSMGALSHGTHSAFFLHYVTGFVSQFYLRKYRTNWFIKYNYIMSAGMDGGAQVLAFLLTFTVFGAGGKAVPFPKWWGNNWQKGNYDFCLKDPGLGGEGHGKKGGGKMPKIPDGGGGGGGD
ncbi:putative phospholipid-transporting ATPase [Venturia nashicola]|nr:putative phospholipid-transporting ATPase [Venturia nashicola]